MALFRNFDDDYHVEEASDEEEFNSSDEEMDGAVQFLSELGNVEPKAKTKDFELEMNSELDTAILTHEAKYNFASTSEKTTKPQAAIEDKTNKKCYDEVYFDSDSDDEDGKPNEDKKKKRRVLSNDELFYDPDMDDEDQKWVDDSRRAYLPKSGLGQPQNPLPKTDGTLTCPACMTILCLDCQRHTLYSSQFRAMFVRNCTVNYSESLHYPEKNKKFKKKQKQASAAGPSSSANPADLYHPVACNICKTEVAVYDSDEVYHFFNVLAGP